MIFVKKYLFFAIRLLYETKYAKYRKKRSRGWREKTYTKLDIYFVILDTNLSSSLIQVINNMGNYRNFENPASENVKKFKKRFLT